MEAFNWSHGVYLGAMMGSEMTAAAVGGTGQLRRDPMAMLPFAGYDMGEYFRHWLNMQKHMTNPPRIFNVNWFRKDESGKYLWPGFGENMRALKWMVDRCNGRADAIETAIGWMPEVKDFDLEGLENFTEADFKKLQAVSPDEWRKEITAQQELFLMLSDTMPKELLFERELLVARL